MAAGEILAVDLVAFEKGDEKTRRHIVTEVRESLETGFVYVRHDLPEEAIDGAYERLREFFALAWDTKEQYTVESSFGQTGYTGLLVETAAQSESADWKEMLNWGPELPLRHPLRERFPHRYMPHAFPEARVPGIRDTLIHLHDRLFGLQRRFLHIVALGVGVDEGYFETMLRDGPTLTRAIRYPPMKGAPDGGEHIWAAAHGDINLTTALPRATARGLQVRSGQGWIDAVAPDGHAIINTGLMLERLTNGVIPAGIHRVVAPPGETGERYSVVQFCHPTPWTILSPIPTCVNSEHPLKDPPIRAGDWLDQVLYDINLLEGGGPETGP